MKSGHLLYIFLLCSTLFACNGIEESERFIEVPPPSIKRNILIEDFTGQKCNNCPHAAEEAHKLQQQYGKEHVIVVGIHAGPLATSTLSTDAGEEYVKYWGIDRFPNGLIDRKKGVHDYTKWSAETYNNIQVDSPLELSIDNVYNEASRSLETKVIISGKESVSGKLQIWLIEDGIQAAQVMPEGNTNREYIHNHVLRATLNGTWGEDMTVTQGEEVNIKHEIVLNSKWNPSNLSIVAFVYNNEGVLQTTISKIK